MVNNLHVPDWMLQKLSPSAHRLREELSETTIRKARLRTRANRLLVMVIALVPAAALLGVAEWIWPILALPLGFHLISRGNVYAPSSFWVWVAFVAAAAISVFSAGDGYNALLTFGAATVVFLFAFNMPEDELPDAAVVRAVAIFWILLALFGLIGLAVGTTEFPSLGAAIADPAPNSSLDVLTRVQFADPLKPGEPDALIGLFDYRPKGFLPFTNHWGSAILLFAGAVIVLRIELRGQRAARWLDALAIATLIPFVVARNRWAWVTVPIIAVYVIARYWRPNPKLARTLLSGVVLLSVLVLATPLRSVVTDRLEDETGNRPEQYELSMELIGEAPWFGYGTIQQGENEEGEIRELGADSQILNGLISYGYPATIMLFGWFVMIAFASRHMDTGITFVAHVAVVSLLLQSPFYNFLPHRLVLVMLLAGAAYRQLYTRRGIIRPPIRILGTGRARGRPGS